jgi:hypothetical protein
VPTAATSVSCHPGRVCSVCSVCDTGRLINIDSHARCRAPPGGDQRLPGPADPRRHGRNIGRIAAPPSTGQFSRAAIHSRGSLDDLVDHFSRADPGQFARASKARVVGVRDEHGARTEPLSRHDIGPGRRAWIHPERRGNSRRSPRPRLIPSQALTLFTAAEAGSRRRVDRRSCPGRTPRNRSPCLPRTFAARNCGGPARPCRSRSWEST